MSYSDDPYSDPPFSGDEDEGAGGALTPGPILSRLSIPGPLGFGTANPPLTPGPALSKLTIPGPRSIPVVGSQPPLTPGPVTSRVIVPGPFLPPTTDDDPPPLGMPERPFLLAVEGQPYARSILPSPVLNGPGGGTYEVPRAYRPAVGDGAAFAIRGRRVQVGVVTSVDDTSIDQAHEVGEVARVTVEGWLSDWGRCVVLPDFGAQDVSRLGRPIQDTRFFDWTMNGGQGDLSNRLSPSYSADGAYGTTFELFDLPDTWPDPNARWMWVAPPVNNAPVGWCHFRVPFYVGTAKNQLWTCASDFAEVWLDGVEMLTCDQPGVAQRLAIDLTPGFHLLTIRAYSTGRRAGVLCSLLPVNEDGLYGTPWMNSRSGWKCLAYPTQSLRLNPGAIVKRLHEEARRRGVTIVSDWVLEFDEHRDSAGRPWPTNAPVVVQVGSTYLQVLTQLAEDLVDFAPDPGSRRLRMWVKDRGTGRLLDSPWTEGIDLLSRVTTRSL